MKVSYETHYSDKYWKGESTYVDHDGSIKTYHGPALAWEGFDLVADALCNVMPEKLSVLDIGCGGGDLAARLMKRGHDCYGVDISDYAVKNAVPSMQGRVALADITQCPTLLQEHRPYANEGDAPPKVFPNQFDLVMATDLLEHLFEEDLEKTFQWLMSKSKKYLFFCVAIATHPRGALFTPQEFVAKKGEPIPPEWEPTAAAGHVNVRSTLYWMKFFRDHNVQIDWERMYLFQMQREFHPDWQRTGGWNMGSTFILRKKK